MLKEDKGRMASIFKSSFGISFFSFIGTIFGFLTQVVLASRFGTGSKMDAYLVSLTIPMMILAIFSGTLNYTFIPVFVENKTKGMNREAWKTANNLFNICFLTFATFGFVMFIYADRIIGGIAPGLSEEVKSTAALLFKIQTPTMLFAGLTALLSSICYAEKRFFRPPIANFANSVIVFVVVYSFSGTLGILAPAWGSLVGSFAMFGILVLGPIDKSKYKFYISFSEKETIRIFKLMVPLLFGAMFYRADDLVQRFIASSLPPGSISYLGYSHKLVSTVASFVVSGFAIVILSHVSDLRSNNDFMRIEHTVSSAFKWLTFFVMPLIVGIVCLGKDIIIVLFQRGHFDELSTHSTWICLMLYCGFFYNAIVGNIVNPIFYAFKDTITIMKIGVTGAVLHALLSFILSRFVSYAGLPLAYSISQLFTLFIFILILNKQYVRIPFKELLNTTILTFSGGAIAALMLWEMKDLLLLNASPYARLIIMAPLLGVLYLAICLLLRVREAVRLGQFMLQQIVTVKDYLRLKLAG